MSDERWDELDAVMRRHGLLYHAHEGAWISEDKDVMARLHGSTVYVGLVAKDHPLVVSLIEAGFVVAVI